MQQPEMADRDRLSDIEAALEVARRALSLLVDGIPRSTAVEGSVRGELREAVYYARTLVQALEEAEECIRDDAATGGGPVSSGQRGSPRIQ